jgi:hypothetical protein
MSTIRCSPADFGETGWRRRGRGNTSNENRGSGWCEPSGQRRGARPERHPNRHADELDRLREKGNALQRLRRHRESGQPEKDERQIRDEHR